MDGNNRWAKKNFFNNLEGYKHGADNLINLTKYLFNKTETKYVSAFALSRNNLSRSVRTINSIKKVLSIYLDKIEHDKIKFNIKFIGDLNFLDIKIKSKISNFNKIQNHKKTLIIFMNYGGIEDIHIAAKNSLVQKKDFKKCLLTSNIPDPDILIRSGGFNRISNFMLYQISFTELYFYKKLWPDLNVEDLKRCIYKYRNIERKFGK